MNNMINDKLKEVMIKDHKLYYYVVYKDVKYVRFELKYNKLKLTVPKNMTMNIEDIIQIKENYLYKKLVKYDKIQKQSRDMKLTQRNTDELREIINKYVKLYSKSLDVKPNMIKLMALKHKWGSCSTKRNITLGEDLRYLPEKLISYIIYHEMTHLIVLDHNDEFFNIIKKEFPDYEKLDMELNKYEFLIFTK